VEGRGANDYAPRVASAAVAEPKHEGCVAAAHAHFEPLAKLLRNGGNKVGVKVVETPHTAQAVLDEADSSAADWIAISSLRRPRLSQLMFGSIADRIIHGARVPVFVHTPEQG
jgi:nucleotide-binding universal stress UspA family protein